VNDGGGNGARCGGIKVRTDTTKLYKYSSFPFFPFLTGDNGRTSGRITGNWTTRGLVNSRML